MYADSTLTPREAVRLCALGSVASAPVHYAALAASVRHFCGRIMGPSLDLLGLSIEMLRTEGLLTALEGSGIEDDALLALTEPGRRELKSLLTARLRPSSDLSKLVVALKFRYLHLLDRAEQEGQLDLLMEASDSELARLEDLREDEATQGSALPAWLDHDLAQLRDRLAWLENFRKTL